MATTIKLEHLLRQGVPDEPGSSFTVSREKYEELPVLPENIFSKGKWVMDKANFYEVSRLFEGCFPAVRLYNEKEVLDVANIVDEQIYWYFVWVEAEEIWIAFKYWNLNTLDESFDSTVRVSIPEHGEIYRLSEEAKKIVSKYYNFG